MAILLILPHPALAQPNSPSSPSEVNINRLTDQSLKLDEAIGNAIEDGLIEKRRHLLELLPFDMAPQEDSSTEDTVVEQWSLTEKVNSTDFDQSVLTDFAIALEKAEVYINQKGFQKVFCPIASNIVSDDIYEVTKTLTPLLILAAKTGILTLPTTPLIISAISIVIVKNGTEMICSGYNDSPAQ